MQVNIHAAKSNLSDLIARAERGEEIVIARANKPVVKLVPVTERKPFRLGMLEGKLGDVDFLEPMSEEELAQWYGGEAPK